MFLLASLELQTLYIAPLFYWIMYDIYYASSLQLYCTMALKCRVLK